MIYCNMHFVLHILKKWNHDKNKKTELPQTEIRVVSVRWEKLFSNWKQLKNGTVSIEHMTNVSSEAKGRKALKSQSWYISWPGKNFVV